MKTLPLICFVFLAPILHAQEIIEKNFALKENHHVNLSLKFADDIKVVTWDKPSLYIKAEIDINNGELNAAHTFTIDEQAEVLKVVTDFDKAVLKEKASIDDCGDNQSSHYNSSGNEGGYSICSTINYTVFLPPSVSLDIETISGNIEIAQRLGATEAKSISGFVDMAASDRQKADLSLKSISGEVYTNLDIALLNKKTNPIVGYELKGKLNGGGEKLKLESISGDVYLRKAD